ncbi:DUF493 domain-containing protein [Lujinxingia vulgaris]|uniref:DUF493 domain-containing protein n=1 Tax=Lujinxingia vulgaris TaxID=2600176 RepID=A0A5C6WTF0_9DELT|nr:DUF493 domain-containing protein [Lujinxingia vulgaris]
MRTGVRPGSFRRRCQRYTSGKRRSAVSDPQTMIDRLNAMHTFPGPFLFKVIGENEPTFVSRVVQAAINAIGGEADVDVETRESGKGKHIAVTLSAQVQGPQEVLDVYELLRAVRGVRFMM